MSKVNVPDLTIIAYKLFVDGAWVGNISADNYKKLIDINAPKFLSVAIHGTDNKFNSAATINTQRISWFQAMNLKIKNS